MVGPALKLQVETTRLWAAGNMTIITITFKWSWLGFHHNSCFQVMQSLSNVHNFFSAAKVTVSSHSFCNKLFSPTMAAKEALFALLENQHSPIEELIKTALACARLHKLSIKTPSKWISESYEDTHDQIDLGTSVESHVRALAILSRETECDETTDDTGTLSDTSDSSSNGQCDDSQGERKCFNDVEGTAKARALAIAAIAGQDKEEIDDDSTTVSTHNLTVVQRVLTQIQQERRESREREATLNDKIKELNEDLKKLSTLVVAQAEIMKEEKIAALDQETRLTKRLQNLEGMISKLSDSITEAATNNSENHHKIARKLSDLKALSTPRQPKANSHADRDRPRPLAFGETPEKSSSPLDSDLPRSPPSAGCTPSVPEVVADKRLAESEVARQPETQSMEKNERLDTSKTQTNEFRTNKIGCIRSQQRIVVWPIQDAKPSISN